MNKPNLGHAFSVATIAAFSIATVTQNQVAQTQSASAIQSSSQSNVPNWPYPVASAAGRGGPGGAAGRGALSGQGAARSAGANAGGAGNGGPATGAQGSAAADRQANAAPGGPVGAGPGATGGRGAGDAGGRGGRDISNLRIPGSNVVLQTFNGSNPPDWFPEAHPAMPEIVAHGRPGGAQACGYCHLPNGFGRPENESVAGLPAGYIVQQVSDFKNELRGHYAYTPKGISTMVGVAQKVTDEDARIAAEYFASIRLENRYKVVETDSIPVVRPVSNMWQVQEGGATEPLGDRLIEVADDWDRFELRDSSLNFTIYVPKGSLKRGEQLVTTGGNGKTIKCSICHGNDLRGIGNVPSIRGRSAESMARQIFDIQAGARRGPYSLLMKEPVRQLTNSDVIAITGYLASLEP